MWVKSYIPNHGSLFTKAAHDDTSSPAASDTWYFTWQVSTAEELEVIAIPANCSNYKEKPNSSYDACRFCAQKYIIAFAIYFLVIIYAKLRSKWSVWRSTSGMTSTIRDHMETFHFDFWAPMMITQKLKNSEKLLRELPVKDASFINDLTDGQRAFSL